MMKRKKHERLIGAVLTLTLVVGLLSPVQSVNAAAKTKISKTKLTMTVGQTKHLTVKTGTKKEKKVKWSTSKKKIATVTSGGKVKAKKAGKATITAKLRGKKYTCKVTVKNVVKEAPASEEQVTTQTTETTATTEAPKTTEKTPGNEKPVSSEEEKKTDDSNPEKKKQDDSKPEEPTSEEPKPEDDIVITTDEMKALVTPKATCEWVDRKATRKEDGVEKIIDEEIQQYTIKWNKKDSKGNYHLPSTAEQFSWIDRSGGGKDVAIEDDNGRFVVTALYFCALRAYDPKNEAAFDDMMRELIDSPTAKKVGGTYGASTAQNCKNELKEHIDGLDKYTYIGKSYFKGAKPENQYTPDNPPAVVLEDFVYAAEPSTQYGTDIYKITVRFAGDDSERHLSVYKDIEDGKWYIFSDTYLGFTADIKRPRISKEEVAPYIKDTNYDESKQPKVEVEEIYRDAQDPNDSSKVIRQPITQAKISFTRNSQNDVFPDTAEKLATIDRSSEYGNLEDDKGRFLTIAAYFAALKSWLVRRGLA